MSDYKVLIVEDNVTWEAKPLAKLVTEAGFEVVGIARTCRDAVALYEKHSPQIVLMDIKLKKGEPTGIDAAKQIRARNPHAKIIYVTGQDAQETMDAVASTNPVGFVRKPPRKHDVIAHLRLAVATLENKHFVFVSYSHLDDDFQKELQAYLKQLPDVGVEYFVDTEIKAGIVWRPEIELALQRATAAVALVSIHMMNSPFIRGVELPALLATHRSLLVIPVFVRAVPQGVLEKSGLDKFQGINSPDDPIESWTAAERNRNAWVPLFDRLVDRLK